MAEIKVELQVHVADLDEVKLLVAHLKKKRDCAQRHCQRMALELASIKRAIGVELEGDMGLIAGQSPVTVEEILLVRRLRMKLLTRDIAEQIDEQRA